MKLPSSIKLISFAFVLLSLVRYLMAQDEQKKKGSDAGQGHEMTITKTTKIESSGTITEFAPGSTIMLKENSGPKTYSFGKTVTYVTRSGKVLDPDVVKKKIKAGVPVRVHYTGKGDSLIIDRVIIDED
jgi:hypothetical protein